METHELIKQIQSCNEKVKQGLMLQDRIYEQGYYAIFVGVLIFILGGYFSLTKDFEWLFLGVYFLVGIFACLAFYKSLNVINRQNEDLEKELQSLFLQIPETKKEIKNPFVKGIDFPIRINLVNDEYHVSFSLNGRRITGNYQVRFRNVEEDCLCVTRVPEDIEGLYRKNVPIHQYLIINPKHLLH